MFHIAGQKENSAARLWPKEGVVWRNETKPFQRRDHLPGQGLSTDLLLAFSWISKCLLALICRLNLCYIPF